VSSDGAYGAPGTRTRILDAAQGVVARRGSAFGLAEVAAAAGVSRQAVYLHFGDRTGLVLALVRHMDETLRLGDSLAHVSAATDGEELLRRAMRLNTEFWSRVRPVAQVLEADRHRDAALDAAWRDRMDMRRSTFRAMIERLDALGTLDGSWTVDDATALLYGVAHFDTWRELIDVLGWTDDRYVDVMSRHLTRSLCACDRGHADAEAASP
jgi:AcrR family transcriptional regulator